MNAAGGPPQAAHRNSVTLTDDSRSVARAVVVDLAAWRRLRRSPPGGDWWGGREMWSWSAADRSRWEWPA